MNQAPPHWYIIVNPAAAGGKVGRKWTSIAAKLKTAGISFEVVFTEKHRHATTLAIAAIENGHRYLIGVGGDGTNNELVNGIMQQEVVSSTEIMYCLLPIGTGNDWIKTHRIPRKLDTWIKMLQAGNSTCQDMGWVEYEGDEKRSKHYFANVAGMAYDAFVVHYVEKLKTNLSNKLIYLWVVLRCLWKYNLSEARLQFGEKQVEDKFYTINVGIGRYSGGGMQFVPHAQPRDGKLALTYVGQLTKWQVIKNTYRFYNGSLGKHPLVHTTQVDALQVESLSKEVPTLLEVDGEYLGNTPVSFGIIPDALQFICPLP